MINIQKTLPSEWNEGLLQEQFRAAGFAQSTVSGSGGYCIVHNVEASDEVTIDNILATHDPLQESVEQQQKASDSTAFTDLLSKAQAGIAQIADDKTALAAATSLADVQPILDNLLTRQIRMIKALAGIVREKR